MKKSEILNFTADQARKMMNEYCRADILEQLHQVVEAISSDIQEDSSSTYITWLSYLERKTRDMLEKMGYDIEDRSEDQNFNYKISWGKREY